MFRFSIRELMLVTLVVALGVAWWLDRSHLAFESGRNREVLMKLRRMGLDVGGFIRSPELSSELEAELNAEYEAAAKRNPKTPYPLPPAL